ncbi:chromate efflux transporter [Roseibium sp. MMSF_3412]|uniref:chromate efflux transporter n=1 Tax=Roseibium sp. MMSF_3412 TaxID=3046712 RepID=UPI00274014A6|nr:chromate efflux transporter [Roseibium sp. MMSF_3412]
MPTPSSSNRSTAGPVPLCEGTPVPWQRMVFVFGSIGLLSFGGPAAQIALMHRKLVEEAGWLSERVYTNALGFCMLLPGPEAMQLATYCGWKLRGVPGGLLAGLLFVIPGAAAIFVLAGLYAAFGNVALMSQLFLGIKAAVLIVVLEVLLRLSRRALSENRERVIAALAFVAIFFLSLPFPLIVLAAALFGAAAGHAPVCDQDAGAAGSRTSSVRTVVRVATWLLVWLAPLALLDWWGGAPILSEIGWFFSKLAVVTFGGAYAVLAYMAQDVVTLHGWLGAGEMMDGLGLAETTPGPLILVTQFVGFLAAFQSGGLWLGLAGGLVALWATFVPCFLWIFAGAPYIDRISALPRLQSALSAIIAAVVGVVLNLSVWFALHVFFTDVSAERHGWLTFWVPDLTSLDWRVPVLAALSGLLLLRFHVSLVWTLLAAALGGAVLSQSG